MAAPHPDYWIESSRNSHAILSRRGVEMDGIETRGSAEGHLAEMIAEAADQDAADAAAIEAEAFEAELDRIHALIDARAGYAAPGDPTSAGINRAVSAALAAIDGIGTAACEDRRAA